MKHRAEQEKTTSLFRSKGCFPTWPVHFASPLSTCIGRKGAREAFADKPTQQIQIVILSLPSSCCCRRERERERERCRDRQTAIPAFCGWHSTYGVQKMYLLYCCDLQFYHSNGASIHMDFDAYIIRLAAGRTRLCVAHVDSSPVMIQDRRAEVFPAFQQGPDRYRVLWQ